MTQKSNDYQIKKLIEYLGNTLSIETAAIDRLTTRVHETPIQELKKRMLQHLEQTHKQKNRLEQIILNLGQKLDNPKSNLSQLVPNTSNIRNEEKFQNSKKLISNSENHNDNFNSIAEETELTKIKQDYLIEYDELVSYDTLIYIAEMTGLSQKNDSISLLKESIQEEESMVYWYQTHAPLILDNLWPKMINSPIKRGQNFLLNYVNSKLPLVIMYADLVGSTNMSMTLPIEDLVLLIRAFTHELSNVIERYDGYVLKYVGDAVISFFPIINDNHKYQICNKSVECAKSIIDIIKKEINSILNEKYGYPKLLVKIGVDKGENAIIQYGYERISPIDILSYSMNVASKITSLTAANNVSIGESVFNSLDQKLQSEFQVLPIQINNWKYINQDTKEPYKIYMLK
ncbi:MAG: DUF892 family protein [Candidatus Nitrosocosmicus sp.]